MTRLVEDHRQQIGTLKALGYSDAYVFGRYMSFAMFPTLIGSVLGVLFGGNFFPYTIMEVYYVLYTGNTKYYTPYNWYYGFIAIVVSVLSTMIATVIACKKSVDTKPCDLMRPKAPSSGKVFFFERFRIWKSFSFIVKAAIRNILRYKKRLFMTLIGVGGCMGLIVVACGLSDSIKVIPRLQFKEIITYDIAAVIKDTADNKDINKIYKYMDEHVNVKYAVKVYGSKATLKKNKKDVELNMMIPEKRKVFEQCITLRNRDSGEIYEMPDEGVVISEKAAVLLGVKEGDKLELELNDKEKVEVKITYITETYFHHYLYMSKEYYEKIYGEKLSINQVYGVYDKDVVNDTNLKDVNEELGHELRQDKNVRGVIYVDDLVKKTEDMVEALNIIVYVLLISAAALTFVVIYNLNSINITERGGELATLKVLGFYDSEVSKYVYRENSILTVVGILIGIFIGKFLHRYIIESVEMNEVMFGVIITRFSYLLSATVTIVFTVAVNYIMNFKIKAIDMLSSLKSVD
jgi:putative ABC transport system permease protein